MKILIFVQSLSVGGAERVASMWANGFVEEGHTVGIVLGQSLKFPRTYYVNSSIEINSVHSEKKGRIENFFDRFKKTGHQIRKFNPDVIITVHHVEDWAIWFFSRFSAIKIISTEHNSFERPNDAPMGKRDYILKYYVNRLFNAVTVLTKADSEYIGKRLKKVYVLPNPLMCSPISVNSDRKKIVMAVGRLESYYVKGFDLLIEAFAAITKTNDDWILRIVGSDLGDGSSIALLKNMVSKYAIIDKVEFMEYQKDVLNLYRECEIFVLSSRYEGFGLVLLEAMSQGCACLACDYKGRQKEIVMSDKYGLLCLPNDVQSLENGLNMLLNDEPLRFSLHKNAPLRAREYTLGRVMDIWNYIFKNLGLEK